VFDGKSPPFAKIREGWGTLKFIRESTSERKTQEDRSEELAAKKTGRDHFRRRFLRGNCAGNKAAAGNLVDHAAEGFEGLAREGVARLEVDRFLEAAHGLAVHFFSEIRAAML